MALCGYAVLRRKHKGTEEEAAEEDEDDEVRAATCLLGVCGLMMRFGEAAGTGSRHQLSAR